MAVADDEIIIAINIVIDYQAGNPKQYLILSMSEQFTHDMTFFHWEDLVFEVPDIALVDHS